MKNTFLPFIFALLSFSCLSAQVNITFEMNSATINSIDPSGIFIAGGTGFGFPGENQLSDPDGDGIYSITINRPMGFSSHYTFLNGNCPDWSCKENLAGLPCADPANFNDRFISNVMSDTTVMACFGTCDMDGSCTIVTDSIDITFELNTELITVDPGGIYIAGGGNFGAPGDNEMLDPDGDGIYTFTSRRPKGFVSHYTFANGNCPDYSCKENIAGLPCADPSAFNDRFLSAVMSDTTIMACYGTCDMDGTCTVVLDSIDLTFELNTSTISVDPGGIFIAGGGNFGNPGDNPMIDPDGDGIYTFTTRRAKGFASHYTFLNGNCPDWSCKEDLEGLECGDPNAFNDRFLPSTMSDSTIMACFGNCVSNGSCESSSSNEISIDEKLFEIRPTVVNNEINVLFRGASVYSTKEIVVLNSRGQVFLNQSSKNEHQVELTTIDFPAGVYLMNVRTKNSMLTKKFVVQ